MPEMLEMLHSNVVDALVRNKAPLERILSIDSLFESFQEPVKQFPINDFAMTSNLFFKDRNELYKKDIEVALTLTSSLSLQTGAFQKLSLDTPIYSMMKDLERVSAFTSNIIVCVISLLLLISSILIYTLMQSDVETRTYEFAMLRVLGFQKNALVTLLTTQTLFFSVPGIVLGFALLYFTGMALVLVLYHFNKFALAFELNAELLLVGLALGITLPLISNIWPIKRALSSTLRNALDVYRSVSVSNLT
jgi:ABC-type antimicrobial peptide transport system permease subunit